MSSRSSTRYTATGSENSNRSVDGVPLWWKAISRNKRCITLDLSRPDGAAVFKDLVRGRDVVIENYRPGTLERWGVGYDAHQSRGTED